MSSIDYMSIVRMHEVLLDKHGDNYLGVGWTKGKQYADLRYKIMLGVIRPAPNVPVQLLDFGCGASHLYEYIVSTGIPGIQYSGLDLSPKYVSLSRSKHPHITYYQSDLMNPDVTIPFFDYIIINGVFTGKGSLSHSDMFEYWQTLVPRVFHFARVGIAFNVMSKYVEWERDDLFYLPLDVVASTVNGKLSRHFVIRHDYVLYEYTVYVYKEPVL